MQEAILSHDPTKKNNNKREVPFRPQACAKDKDIYLHLQFTIYAFSRRFIKATTIAFRFIHFFFISTCVPWERTHNLSLRDAMFYQLSHTGTTYIYILYTPHEQNMPFYKSKQIKCVCVCVYIYIHFFYFYKKACFVQFKSSNDRFILLTECTHRKMSIINIL